MDGLQYLPNFITPEQAKELLSFIERSPWSSALKRRTQHYGYVYDYTKKRVSRDMYLGPLPSPILELGVQLMGNPEQAIVNEYYPGQGISHHVDCVPCFGPTICSVSLLSPVAMEFRQYRGSGTEELLLQENSALILSGEARYGWSHAIIPRMKDGDIVRRRRISVTFRTMVVE